MTVEKQTMTPGQAIVSCIKSENIEKVFCVPGESYLPLLDALYDEQTIQVISNRQEGGAAFMAEGYAKATLKPGIVLATRGPGAANLTIGVHTAMQDSTPMVIFLGQVHSKFKGREGFQEVDFEQFFAPITKWAVEVNHVERIPEIVSRAFRVAQSGRPGPVVVSLPEDMLIGTLAYQTRKPIVIPKPRPANEEVEVIVALLEKAEKPLIIAGGGVKSAGAEQRLINFSEENTLPVMAAFRRHDVFPNEHTLFAGHLGIGTGSAVQNIVKEADVILALGTRLSEITTQDYTLFESNQKLIHIDIDANVLGKSFVPEIGVVADVDQALDALAHITLPTDKWKTWAYRAHQVYEAASALTLKEGDAVQKEILFTLKEHLPDDAIITNDAGNFAIWLHQYYRFSKPHTYVGPTSGAMGYGMPAALGVKLANPERKVVSLSGDGGFMMTIQELETAVRYQIPIICLVFNNSMYGTIRMHQEQHFPERVMATDLGTVSFSELAKSLGATGYTVETGEAFAKVFTSVLEEERLTVIEIMTDREQISPQRTITEIRETASK